MARINKTKIKRSERSSQRRYTNYGTKRVYSALRKMVDPLNPYDPMDPAPMQKAIEDIYIYAGVDSAKKEYNRISKDEAIKAVPDFFIDTWTMWIRDYVRNNLGFMIVRITENTRKIINDALQEGIDLGETRTDLAKRIRKRTLGEIGKARSRTIARTESQTAANIGKGKSAEDWARQTGTNLYKIWIHMDSMHDRPHHMALDSNPPIPKGMPFEIHSPTSGVVFADAPAAIGLPASERINCNCVVVYMSERKAMRDYFR